MLNKKPKTVVISDSIESLINSIKEQNKPNTKQQSKNIINIFINKDNINPNKYVNIENLYVVNDITEAKEIIEFVSKL